MARCFIKDNDTSAPKISFGPLKQKLLGILPANAISDTIGLPFMIVK